MSDHGSFDGSDGSQSPGPSPGAATSKRARSDKAAADGSTRTTGKRKMSEFDKSVRSEAARSKREVNRLAQQQARFKRQQYIIELETRLELLSRPEPERIKHLGSIIGAVIAENRQLRKLCQTLSGFLTEGLPSVLPRMGMTTELYEAIINRGEHEAAIDSFCANKKRLEAERLAALSPNPSRPSKKAAPAASSSSSATARTTSNTGPSPAATAASGSAAPSGSDPAPSSQHAPPPPPPPTPAAQTTVVEEASASPVDFAMAQHEAGGTSGSDLAAFTTPFSTAMSPADVSFWSTPGAASYSPSDVGRPPNHMMPDTGPSYAAHVQQVPLHGPPLPVQQGLWSMSSALDFLSSLPPGLAYDPPPQAPLAPRVGWVPPPEFDFSTSQSPAMQTASSSHPHFFDPTRQHPQQQAPPQSRPFGR